MRSIAGGLAVAEVAERVRGDAVELAPGLVVEDGLELPRELRALRLLRLGDVEVDGGLGVLARVAQIEEAPHRGARRVRLDLLRQRRCGAAGRRSGGSRRGGGGGRCSLGQSERGARRRDQERERDERHQEGAGTHAPSRTTGSRRGAQRSQGSISAATRSPKGAGEGGARTSPSSAARRKRGRAIREERQRARGDPRRGHLVLHQLGEGAAPEQDVGQRDVRRSHQAPGDRERQRIEPVGDHRRSPREGRLQRGRAGGAQRGVEAGEQGGSTLGRSEHDRDPDATREEREGQARRRGQPGSDHDPGRGHGPGGEQGRGGLGERSREARDLSRAAPGEDREGGGGEPGERRSRCREHRGMPHVDRVVAGATPEGLLERQDHREPVRGAAQGAQPARPPRPHLRGDAPEHPRPPRAQHAPQVLVHLGEVDQQGRSGRRLEHAPGEPTERRGEPRQPRGHVGEPHGRDRPAVREGLHTRRAAGVAAHSLTAHPAGGERGRDHGGDAIAGGLAGDDQHLRRAHASCTEGAASARSAAA